MNSSFFIIDLVCVDNLWSLVVFYDDFVRVEYMKLKIWNFVDVGGCKKKNSIFDLLNLFCF